MKKSGKIKKNSNSKNSKNNPKTPIKKETSLLKFQTEEDYMNYVGQQNKMTNNIIEYFDEPYDFLMGNSDNIITKSTYTKIEYENGMPVNEEIYQSHSAKHKDKNGHKITEKHEKYKNKETGEEKISTQRLLDGKGTKNIKKRNVKSGTKEEHNILKGLKENDIKTFNKNYEDYKEKVGFEKLTKDTLIGNKRNRSKILAIGDGKDNIRKKSFSTKEENSKSKNKGKSKEKIKKKSKSQEKNKVKNNDGKKSKNYDKSRKTSSKNSKNKKDNKKK